MDWKKYLVVIIGHIARGDPLEKPGYENQCSYPYHDPHIAVRPSGKFEIVSLKINDRKTKVKIDTQIDNLHVECVQMHKQVGSYLHEVIIAGHDIRKQQKYIAEIVQEDLVFGVAIDRGGQYHVYNKVNKCHVPQKHGQ